MELMHILKSVQKSRNVYQNDISKQYINRVLMKLNMQIQNKGVCEHPLFLCKIDISEKNGK